MEIVRKIKHINKNQWADCIFCDTRCIKGNIIGMNCYDLDSNFEEENWICKECLLTLNEAVKKGDK